MPEKMETDAERTFAETAGTIPAWFHYKYNGDVNAQPIPAAKAPATDSMRNTIHAMVKVGELSLADARATLQQLLAEISTANTSTPGTFTEADTSFETAKRGVEDGKDASME
jgi:hypothetical protein